MTNPLKKVFTPDEVLFLKTNHKNFTNKQLFEHINANRPDEKSRFKITTFRTAMYSLGLQKCKITRWEPEWVQFLTDNYQTMGDVELAEKLNKQFKIKLTKKHVNKKRRCLMGLNRTPEQIASIIALNKDKGTFNTVKKSWETRGIAEIGEVRINKVNGCHIERIRTENGFVNNARFQYEKHFGPVPKGYKVYHKDCDKRNNEPANLIIKPAMGLSSLEKKLYKINDVAYKKSIENKNTTFESNPIIGEMNTVKEGKIRVTLSPKLTVFVKPGTDIGKLREKYREAI